MLTDTRIDTIFTEMDTYILELVNDPNSLGPQYFQDIIATCRTYLNKVSLIISELNREKLIVSGELRRLESSYAVEYDDLLANNDRVRALASIDDRKATAGFLLKKQKLRINELKDQMHTLESVSKVVLHRNKELHATMTAIKDQRRLMQTEISTGSFYGDERIPKSQRPPRDPNAGIDLCGEEDINMDELAAMLSSDSSEDSSSEDSSSEDSSSEDSSEFIDDEVINFLGSADGDEIPSKKECNEAGGNESDIDSVLSMLEGL